MQWRPVTVVTLGSLTRAYCCQRFVFRSGPIVKETHAGLPTVPSGSHLSPDCGGPGGGTAVAQAAPRAVEAVPSAVSIRDVDGPDNTGSDEDFQVATAPSAYRAWASDLREGGYMVINGFPAKIANIAVSGNDLTFTGNDVFTDNPYRITVPPTESVEVPYVSRTNYNTAGDHRRGLPLTVDRGWRHEERHQGVPR